MQTQPLYKYLIDPPKPRISKPFKFQGFVFWVVMAIVGISSVTYLSQQKPAPLTAEEQRVNRQLDSLYEARAVIQEKIDELEPPDQDSQPSLENYSPE